MISNGNVRHELQSWISKMAIWLRSNRRIKITWVSKVVHSDVTIDETREDHHIHHWRVGYSTRPSRRIKVQFSIYFSMWRLFGSYRAEAGDDITIAIIEQDIIRRCRRFPSVSIPIGSIEWPHKSSMRANTTHVGHRCGVFSNDGTSKWTVGAPF